jgi:hypothetical protein
VLVPLTGTWHPVAVAWGVVAAYLLFAVEVTSLLRQRLPRHVWRSVHFASFPLFAFSTVHLLTAGTDAASGVLRWSAVGVTATVAPLTARRIDQADEAAARAAIGRRTTAG